MSRLPVARSAVDLEAAHRSSHALFDSSIGLSSPDFSSSFSFIVFSFIDTRS